MPFLFDTGKNTPPTFPQFRIISHSQGSSQELKYVFAFDEQITEACYFNDRNATVEFLDFLKNPTHPIRLALERA